MQASSGPGGRVIIIAGGRLVRWGIGLEKTQEMNGAAHLTCEEYEAV